MTFTVDTEKVKRKIAFIQDKLREEANPQLLNEYRLLLKKGVPFFRRSWTAAYLLMLYDQEQSRPNSRWERGEGLRTKPKAPVRNEARQGRDNRGGRLSPDASTETAYNPADKVILTEEESTRLFISIGRNRRLFPREILGLIINAAQVEREDIGSIRILDNYSFVQVRDTVADKIIEALNGTLFRGRTLAVNYAHTKREGETEDRDAADGEDAPPVETPDLTLAAEQGNDLPDKERV
ncbi:MAG: DbpA RNA binding domain-containing protein [Treponema sp.]|jgi:hypothetical protein|nr:DbpA RNA binding domain-containing protein [Treponema sp.]